MSFDRSWDALAVLLDGMPIHYSHADPSGDMAALSFISGVIVLDWYKKVASVLSQLRMLCNISVIVSESSHMAVRSAKL